MRSRETTDIKRFLQKRIDDVKKLPIDKTLRGFSKKAETSKREGYISGLETALKLVEHIEKQ
jgi:hypothetical protein